MSPDSNAAMPLPPSRTPIRPLGLAAGLYFLLTLLLTWPLALHIGSRVPNDLGDSLLNMFILAWDARAVPFTAQWWNLPQFYPAPGVLAFSEHLLGLSIVTTPIIAATGSVLAAYNVAFILSFLLCGVAAHLLCFELTRRHDVSLVCGVAYAFAPYRMSQLAHLQVLSAYWVPLTLLGLHLYLRSPLWRWLALFAGSWLMQALACGYYLFYLSVLVGLWILWFAIGRMRAVDVGRLLAGWGLAAVALVPVARGYLTYQGQYGLRRWPDEIQAFSGDVASLLTAPETVRLWSWLEPVRRPESAFFPGVTLLLVIAAGAAIAWSIPAREGVRRLRTPRVLGAAASALILIAGTPIMFGPWKLEIGGVRLLSVGSAHKPFSIAVVLLAGALALHPSMRAGWARRSALVFYAIAAVIMWVFSLGPAPTFMNEPLLYKAPYAWLMHVPGVDGVRVPARFWVLATMCLSVACALALRQVLARWGGRRLLPACVATLLLVESWPRPLMLEPEPAARPAYGRAVARLELPTSPAGDLVALYRAIEHRRPLVNGYSGYFAPHYPALQHLLERRDPAALTYLTSLGRIEVVVDHAGDGDGSWRAYVGKYPGAERVHRAEAFTVYHLPRSAAASSRSGLPGRPLPIADIQASRGQERAHLMIDGDRVSRWHTPAPQEPGDEIVVDLGNPVMVAGVELRLAGYVADFPRLLRIEISDDRAEWREVWSGSAAREALIAAIEDPRDIPLRFPMEAAGRFVRLRQLGSDPTFFWSIAELRVHGT